MKVVKKELKDAVTIIKRLSKNKTDAVMTVQSAEDKLYLKSSNNEINAFFEIANLDGSELSIQMNPYDLETLLKGKEKELEFELLESKKEFALKGDSKGIPYQTFSSQAKNKLTELIPLNDPERFVNILKEAETVFCDSTIQGSSYLEFNKQWARALEPKRIHYYRYEETFDFDNGFIHQDAVKFLSKTLKGEIMQKKFGDYLVLQNGIGNYAIKLYTDIFVPDFKQIKRKEELFSFVIDGKVVNEKLKNYKTKVKEIEVTMDNGELVLNPRNEDFEIYRIQVENFKGEYQNVVFDAEAFKGLFTGFDEKIQIKHQVYQNNSEDGYMWWIYQPEKIIMVAGIYEPDYEKPWKEVFEKA